MSALIGFTLETPLGALRGLVSDAGLAYLSLPRPHGEPAEPPPQELYDLPVVERTRHPHLTAVRDYFRGRTLDIDIPVDLSTRTPFQRAVLLALRDVRAGETVSYGELAARAGRPRAARAVGGAVGSNPLPIVIPCHRVLASGGRIGGFGGGLDAKRWLLRHEGLDV